MIRFESQLTSKETKVLNDALDFYEDRYKIECEWDDEIYWRHIVKIFGSDKAVHEHILTLREILNSKQLYDITDYSYYLLYEMLMEERDLWRDTGSKKNRKHAQLCDDIINFRFWDTDFLFDSSTFNKLTIDQRKMFGFNQETFGLVNGMVAHPDELKPTPSHGVCLD